MVQAGVWEENGAGRVSVRYILRGIGDYICQRMTVVVVRELEVTP
jgi:hypothetical protein